MVIYPSSGHRFPQNGLHAFSPSVIFFYDEQEACTGAMKLKPSGIRNDLVSEAQQTISKPGFRVDTFKLAEKLVAVLRPLLFGQSQHKIRSQNNSPESLQSSELRSVEISESLNESA